MLSSLKSMLVVDVRGNSVLRTARTMPEGDELGVVFEVEADVVGGALPSLA